MIVCFSGKVSYLCVFAIQMRELREFVDGVGIDVSTMARYKTSTKRRLHDSEMAEV